MLLIIFDGILHLEGMESNLILLLRQKFHDYYLHMKRRSEPYLFGSGILRYMRGESLCTGHAKEIVESVLGNQEFRKLTQEAGMGH